MGGEAGDQCSIFVSLSFSASAVLSSNGGDFSFFSSSIGLGELLLAAENNTGHSKTCFCTFRTVCFTFGYVVIMGNCHNLSNCRQLSQ